MDSTLGRLAAELAEPDHRPGAINLIDLINRNINPPAPVTASAVYIRAMYVVSDDINSFGGRFPIDEHTPLCRLLVDSPVMVGHRRDRLPIARTFYAKEVERNGRRWVKCWFYWLRAAEGAETLRENIDGGIYRECSISFTFLFPECSICGRDIRTCIHQPFEKYAVDGRDQVCHFCYRKIERVLETSLVYRGAVPDTRLTKDLIGELPRNPIEIPLESPTELPPARQYLVTPYYEGIPVIADLDENGLALERLDNLALPDSFASKFSINEVPSFQAAPGYLVGYQGKTRCAVAEVEHFLKGETSEVTRLELRLLPGEYMPAVHSRPCKTKHQIHSMRGGFCTLPTLHRMAASFATRDGVRIWPEDRTLKDHAGYRYRPDPDHAPSRSMYTLMQTDTTGAAHLTFTHDGVVHRYVIWQFHLQRLVHGAKFLADCNTHQLVPPHELSSRISGHLLEVCADNGGFGLRFDGKVAGSYILRPIYLNGEHRFLFYRLPQPSRQKNS